MVGGKFVALDSQAFCVTEVVRYQSVVPNHRGTFPGVFALANGLASDHMLSRRDALRHRAENDRANTLYSDPAKVSPGCFDPIDNAGARSWFNASAGDLIEMTHGYLELLTKYGVGWVELRTSSRGRITYQDEVQVVAVPPTYAEWPFQPAR